MNVKLGLLSGLWRALWTPHISRLLCPCPPKGTCVASGAPAALPCLLIIFCSANICFCWTEGALCATARLLRGTFRQCLATKVWWEKPKPLLHFTLTQSCGSSTLHPAQKHTYSTVVLFIWRNDTFRSADWRIATTSLCTLLNSLTPSLGCFA